MGWAATLVCAAAWRMAGEGATAGAVLGRVAITAGGGDDRGGGYGFGAPAVAARAVRKVTVTAPTE
jgi:hypothetical protein